jgi:isoleucyl-tRNA synthetase
MGAAGADEAGKGAYKASLNLPHTDFPMKASLPTNEPKWLEFWQQQNLYHSMQQRRQGAKTFILADGPPYANGNIHIGHALNKILKDIIIKAKHLAGYQVHYRPGWDCHGLPIEHKVEQKLGTSLKQEDPSKFQAACRSYAEQQVMQQQQSFIRLGICADWSATYTTMQYAYEANVMRALGKILEQGLLAQEQRPVNWCTSCASALAEAEVEYLDKRSWAIDVAFPVRQPTQLAQIFAGAAASFTQQSPAALVIWTTTPWTLPANQAVAVHANLKYVCLRLTTGQLLILAEDLLPAFLQRSNSSLLECLGTCLGEQLAGLELAHPFLERVVPVLTAAFVSNEAGTGCVHMAPAHGYDDYIVCKQHGIEPVNLIDGQGRFTDSVSLVAGQSIAKASETVLAILAQQQSLLSQAELQHSYPHCWRHKTPLLFRATPQWFIKMEQSALRTRILAAIEQVEWLPTWGKARMQGMIQNKPDWCLSRQRLWGVPLPLLLHKTTRALHPQNAKYVEQLAAIVAERGLEAWRQIDLQELCGPTGVDYQLSPDVLDVWFDSGVYHFAIAQAAYGSSQVDLYLEGADQYRGWFQSSLVTAIAMNAAVPYRQVLTHGFVVDTDRQKLSKSSGKALAPEHIVQSLGADILRLWVAASDFRGDLAVSEEIFARITDAYRRIRNTARFLLANLHDFQPASHLLAPQHLLAIDQFLLWRAGQLHRELVDAYQQFQFHLVYQKLHNFCVEDLGGLYLDIIKDRQYTGRVDGRPRRAAQTAMYHLVRWLAQILAPILSFTAEEIWQHIPSATETAEASVFYEQWQAPPMVIGIDPDTWQQLLAIRVLVNKQLELARAAGVIGSALEAALHIVASAKQYQVLASLGAELRFFLIVSAVQLVEGEGGLEVTVKTASMGKCPRCWHRVLPSSQPEATVCERCALNLAADGSGEVRNYA